MYDLNELYLVNKNYLKNVNGFMDFWNNNAISI